MPPANSENKNRHPQRESTGDPESTCPLSRDTLDSRSGSRNDDSPSSFTTRLPSPLVLAIFLLAFTANFLALPPIFHNPDLPFHLMAGGWMLEQGRIPVTDPWSYTARDTHWLNISWLWDIFVHQLFRYADVEGLHLLACLLGAISVAVAGSNIRARGQVDDTHTLLATGLLWLGMLPFLTAQPQALSFILIPLFHRLCHDYTGDHGIDKKRTLYMALMMALWVNVHGGFFIGFAILAAHMITAYFRHDTRKLRAFFITATFCALACLINPYHIFIVEAVLRSLDSVITSYIQEWQPVQFGTLNISLPLFLFILSSNIRDERISVTDRVMVFTCLLGGLFVIRNFVVFLLIAMPYMALHLQEFARRTQGERFRSPVLFPNGLRYQLRLVVFTALIIPLLATPFAMRTLLPTEKFITDRFQLHEAITYLQTHHPDTRFINDYNLGGNLILHSGGHWPVFVDGRAGTAYPESLLADTISFSHGTQEDAIALLQKHNINGMLLLHTHARASHPLTPKWQEVFRNAYVVAYVQK